MNHNSNDPIIERLDLAHTKYSKATEEKLKEIMKSAKPLQPNQVDIMHLTLKKSENGDLVSTVLIRNGTQRILHFQSLPLCITERVSGMVVAKGTFSLKNLTVQPFTSKPATFVFPASSIHMEPIDLSSCRVTYPDSPSN